MNTRLRLGLLAAVVGWFAVAVPAFGQAIRLVPPSHVPIPGGGVSPDVVEDFFKGRLQDAKTSGELEKLVRDVLRNPRKYNLTERDRDRLLADDFDPNNPEVRRKLERIIRRELEQGADPEQEERWKRLIEEFGRRDPPERPTPPSPVPLTPPTQVSPSTGDPPPAAPPPPPPGRTGTAPFQPPPPGKGSPPSSSVDSRLHKLGERLLRTRLAESPTLQNTLAKLARMEPRQQTRALEWAGMSEEWERRFVALARRLPDISWSPGSSSSGGRSLPREAIVPVEVPAGEGAMPLGLILGGAGVIAVLVWGVLRAPRIGLLRRRTAGWRLGPWPVPPAAVRTRDDLVRAFEYLSVLLLGPAARSCNHRDLAAGLGGEAPDQQAAAERLAALYEQARYAPPDEVLPDDQMAGARRDLRFLAGASAA